MMDPIKMEAGIRLFLEGLGERFAGDDLEKTPARVGR
jgi:GTP cyclohydrolase I